MIHSQRFRPKRLPSGRFEVDQGEVNGYPISFNPDDQRFYVHEKGTTDGTATLATFKEVRNAVQYARTH